MKKALLVICSLFFNYFVYAQNYSATEVINKSKAAYGTIQTYFDSGKVVSSFYNNSRPHSNAKYFKTSYSSNGLFNFEYYVLGQSNSLYVINQSKNLVQSWWGITNHTKSYNSINMPLAAAAGVSSLLSTLIPKLLLPSKTSQQSWLESLASPTLIGTEIINGTSCFVISGKDVLQNDIKIWIADKDFLIRRLIIDMKLTNFNVKSTYQFFPYQPTDTIETLFVFRPNRQIEL